MRANLRKLLVVGTTAGRVDQSSGDARNEEIVADLELDGVIDSLALGLQHVVELFGLYDGSRMKLCSRGKRGCRAGTAECRTYSQ